MRRRTPKSHEARCFPFTASLTAFPDRKRKRFLAFARNDDAGKTLCHRKGGFSLLPPTGDTPKAMCKKWQPYSSRSPSFLRKEVPRRGGVGSPLWAQKECEIHLSRFVIPSAAEGSFSFPVSVFLRKAVCMRRRTPKLHEARCFPFPALLTAFPDRERKRFLAFARNDDTGKRLCYREGGFSLLPPTGDTPKAMREEWQLYSCAHSPSFLWKEVPRRGGGWLC